MYANPRTILEYLACHGPSATQAEALALLGRPVSDRWPECPRRSRLSLLRRLACNRKKSTSARLRALREVMMGVNTEPENVTANTTVSPEAVEIDAIFLRYQDRLEEQTQSQLRRLSKDEPEETPRESLEKLYALGDDAVDNLMQSTRQQFTREVRAGRR